ncbi:MAG: hypothetical protein JW841_05205 [Deltaproteobacteria bacterium]|nr:hypothetical protein [Deltaproteobacteria bacterium]
MNLRVTKSTSENLKLDNTNYLTFADFACGQSIIFDSQTLNNISQEIAQYFEVSYAEAYKLTEAAINTVLGQDDKKCADANQWLIITAIIFQEINKYNENKTEYCMFELSSEQTSELGFKVTPPTKLTSETTLPFSESTFTIAEKGKSLLLQTPNWALPNKPIAPSSAIVRETALRSIPLGISFYFCLPNNYDKSMD